MANDTAGNGNTAATQWSIVYDNTAPTVAIASNSGAGPTNNAAMTLTFTFSKEVSGFDATDVSVTNATKGTFTPTNSTVYTLAITATGANVTANVAANAANDDAGNGNTASTWSIIYTPASTGKYTEVNLAPIVLKDNSSTPAIFWTDSPGNTRMNWDDARKLCETNGVLDTWKDWRLPTVAELKDAQQKGILSAASNWLGSSVTDYFWSSEANVATAKAVRLDTVAPSNFKYKIVWLRVICISN
jgi:hypothetical protein